MRIFRTGLLAILAISVIPLGPFARGEDDPRDSSGAKKNDIRDVKALSAFIDQQIEAKLAKNNITPAPLADDAEFLRRASLDLTGRIPLVSEAREFLTSKNASKRDDFVDRMLTHHGYVNHFTTTWSNWILPDQGNAQVRGFSGPFENWLRENIKKNLPYNQLAQEIITASFTPPRNGQPINPNGNGAFAFFQANEQKPENAAAATSRIFLGVRLDCAQCHDHPFAEWKRQQFWEYAAFFANIQRGRIQQGKALQNVPTNLRTLKIPGTTKTVSAKYLDGKTPLWQGDDPRSVLANWITAPENPYFARTTVNRLWAHFMGVGLIEPVDDQPTEENPISHPELLEELSRQFIAHNYDVQFIIKAITKSKTYQRSSSMTHPGQKEPRLFARMAVRGLTAEQLFDSLAQATGYRENARRGQFVGMGGNSIRSQFLVKFQNQDTPTERQTSILQALTLMNGVFIANATSLENSKTMAAIADAPFFNTEEKIKTLYLATLTRMPREEELSRLTRYVTRGGTNNNQRAALADVFWALLNSSEFILNH